MCSRQSYGYSKRFSWLIVIVPFTLFQYGSSLSSSRSWRQRKEERVGQEDGWSSHVLRMSRPLEVPQATTYGCDHPFLINDPSCVGETETNEGQRRKTRVSSPFRSIRVYFHFVDESLRRVQPDNRDGSLSALEAEDPRGAALVSRILPEVAAVWASVLSVVPSKGNLFVGAAEEASTRYGVCRRPDVNGVVPVPVEHTTVGVPNVDVVVYVRVDDPDDCAGDPSSGSDLRPFGVPCELDQFDRPVAATLDLCLHPTTTPSRTSLNTNTSTSTMVDTSTSVETGRVGLSLNRHGRVPDHALRDAVRDVVEEIGHILGRHTELFKFFRHPVTGVPLTPRPFVEKTVECVDGSQIRMFPPACNTLRKDETAPTVSYEVVTPTVLQVVRNQFDCPVATGARLENQWAPTSTTMTTRGLGPANCVGSWGWDDRFFLGEHLSPLTLALLEDSGWYRADYTSIYVKPQAFGRGAGCDFLYQECLSDRGLTVPSYSRGFFCNRPLTFTVLGTLEGRLGCDASGHRKARCDLVDYSDTFFRNFHDPPPPQYQYFANPNFGAFNYRTDFCPVSLEVDTVGCGDADRAPLFRSESEYYGVGGRCFEVDGNVDTNALCLRAHCNTDDRTLKVFVGAAPENHNDTTTTTITPTPYVCRREGQTLTLKPEGQTIVCPRLEAFCPQFLCPANCAGRGVCDVFPGSMASCRCFDKTDRTDGCYESPMAQPLMDISVCAADDDDPIVSRASNVPSWFAVTTILLASLFVSF